MDPATYEHLRNKTLLFFIEKLLDPSHGGAAAANNSSSSSSPSSLPNNLYTNKRTLHDLSCQFGSKGFTKEMRQISGGSQSGLKKFLQSYPSIFRIDGDIVSYNVNTSVLPISNNNNNNNLVSGSSSNTQNNDGGGAAAAAANNSENNNENNVSTLDNEAVEYFRERLMQYGIGIWVPVKSLLGHRSQAPPHIRHVSGQHIREFTTFLSKYPETFILNAQDEVLLKEFENYYENYDDGGDDDITGQLGRSRIMLLGGGAATGITTTTTTTTNNNNNNVIDKKRIVELIEFYANCLVERGPMLVEQLFCAGNLIQSSSSSSSSSGGEEATTNNEATLLEYFKCPNDLATFFKLYPQCFQVHSNLVTFSDTYKVGLEYLKRQTGGIVVISKNNNQIINKPSPIAKVSSTTPSQPPQLPKKVEPPAPPPPPPASSSSSSSSSQSPTKKPAAAVVKPDNTQQPGDSSTTTKTTPNPKSLLKARVSKILLQTINQNTEHDYKREYNNSSSSSSSSSSTNKSNSSSSGGSSSSSSSSGGDQQKNSSQFARLCEISSSTNNGDNIEELKNYILSRTTIVSNQRKASQIVEEILASGEPVSLDFEGVNLGNDGVITLVQVGTMSGDVFIFDVLTQPGLIEKGMLGRLLCDGGNSEEEEEEEEGSSSKRKSSVVVKVMHDCRNDSVNLYRQFGIKLTNVFDTQVAHIVIQMMGGNNGGIEEDNNDEGGGGERSKSSSKNISLNNLCGLYGGVSNPFKDKVKSVYRHDQKYWSRRPLTKQMIAYASCDVMCLVPGIYNTISSKILSDDERVRLFRELCEEQVLTHIEPEEIRSRRRLRKNEADLRGLRGKLDKAFVRGGGGGSNSSLVLSNREMRLLKHLNLTEEEKERLKLSLKVAKKLEKMSSSSSSSNNAAAVATTEQQHQSSDSTSNSELTSLEYSSTAGGGGGGVTDYYYGNNYNNNNSLGGGVVDPRIAQIDSLEAIINRLINDNNNEEEEEGEEVMMMSGVEEEGGYMPREFIIGGGGSSSSSSRRRSGVVVYHDDDDNNLVDRSTQTISTGDIVITKLYDD